MNAQEELKELKEKIIELEERIKAEQEPGFPKDGDKYWYISVIGFVIEGNYDAENSVFEHFLYKVGNMFKTKEEAEFAAEKLKVEAELRKLSTPYAYGESLMLNYHLKSRCLVNVVADNTYKEMGEFYFESNDKINEARETVGEERIKKYIFGVEER